MFYCDVFSTFYMEGVYYIADDGVGAGRPAKWARWRIFYLYQPPTPSRLSICTSDSYISPLTSSFCAYLQDKPMWQRHLTPNCEDMECTECSDCKESPQRRCKAGFGCFSSFKDKQLEKGCIADDYHYKIICTNTAHVIFCCKEDLCNLNVTFPFADKQPSKSLIRMEY